MASNSEYAEILTSLRHYSNLRFASLTLFSAITGGLFSAAFGTGVDDQVLRDQMRFFWPCVGVLASIIFFLLECCVTSFVVSFRKYADEINPTGHFNRTPSWARHLARHIFKSLYLLLMFFWVAVLFTHWRS